jgi:hypothetical protein
MTLHHIPNNTVTIFIAPETFIGVEDTKNKAVPMGEIVLGKVECWKMFMPIEKKKQKIMMNKKDELKLWMK